MSHFSISLGAAVGHVLPGEAFSVRPTIILGTLLRREYFSLLVESSRPPAAPPPDRSGTVEQAIATRAARFIPDGATLEFGIGTVRHDIGLGGRTRSQPVIDMRYLEAPAARWREADQSVEQRHRVRTAAAGHEHRLPRPDHTTAVGR